MFNTIIIGNRGFLNSQNIPAYGVQFLIVAGGGGGDGFGGSGGGGAGGIVQGTYYPLYKNTSLIIIIGGGGSLSTNGSNSSIRIGTLSASPIAMAFGGGNGATGSSGGSGGGSGSFVPPLTGGNNIPGIGDTSFGNNGGSTTINEGSYGTQYYLGGGGGAGSAGGTGNYTNVGGIGIINPITSSQVGQLSAGNYWIGGGGGGGYSSSDINLIISGGIGGGSNSAMGYDYITNSGIPAIPATANTGGGGGGSAVYYDGDIQNDGDGSAGGSGVVVLTYTSLTQLATGGTVTNPSPGYWIHTFTSSGTLTF